MVIARRDDYRLITNGEDDRWEYIGKYSYIAPNGKQYKMKFRDCQRFLDIPPETMTLYLEKWNYGKYYIKGSLNLGKHGAFFFLLSWVIGTVVCFNLISHLIMPLVLQ